MLSSILSVSQKFFSIKKEKNSLYDLSHDVRKPFSANETFNAGLLMKLFKLLLLCYPVASFVRLPSGFEELFIRETEQVKKPGGRGG